MSRALWRYDKTERAQLARRTDGQRVRVVVDLHRDGGVLRTFEGRQACVAHPITGAQAHAVVLVELEQLHDDGSRVALMPGAISLATVDRIEPLR